MDTPGTPEEESSLMLEFAAQAFQARNLQLACDIYERVDWGLLLRRAECLAGWGRLQDACALYQRAAAQHRLRAEHLDTLLGCLAEQVRSREAPPQRPAEPPAPCQQCQGFLQEPLTLPCGHTVCRRCLQGAQCRLCGASLPEGTQWPRANVLLCTVLSKWFPARVQAGRLSQEGGTLLHDNRLEDALDKYSQAIRLVPLDHLLYSDRCTIYLSLKSYDLALDDAEMVCKLQPHWLKGHLRKAQALNNLGRTEDALKEFLLCLALDRSNRTAKSEAQKVLLNMLSPGHSQGDFPDVLQMLSHPTRLKGGLMSSLSCTETSSNTHSLYRANMELKKHVIATEQNVPIGCNAAQKLALASKNKADQKKDDAPSSEECLTTSLTCNRLKRKLSTEETEKLASMEMLHKLPKIDTSADACANKESSVSIVESSDLECSLCMRLLYEPVTTPCGHTYCLKCLERCLDHNPKCPLCKEDLCKYLATRKFCKTELIEDLIANYFPEELKERKMVNEEEIAELSNLNKNVPIFVCTMAYPTVPCPLHIFEPCYRLMIRRCIETGTKQFGMCIGDSVKGFADYGCMLEIRNVEFFADGRSVVDSIGKRRFKVISHSQRDGYNTADIEYIEDEKVTEENCSDLRMLHDSVYDQASTWFNNLKPALKSRILGHFGSMPVKDSDLQVNPNGPAWCWWILAVLPLESRAQLPFLAMTSLKDRLTSIRRILLFMCRSRTK
ncbi:LON peptidase N-terminal domain and RING finger protein 3 [Gastrophryne carolinensis]